MLVSTNNKCFFSNSNSTYNSNNCSIIRRKWQLAKDSINTKCNSSNNKKHIFNNNSNRTNNSNSIIRPNSYISRCILSSFLVAR